MLLTPHTLAKAVEMLTTAMTLVGMSFMVVAIASAQAYLRFQNRRAPPFGPSVSILQ